MRTLISTGSTFFLAFARICYCDIRARRGASVAVRLAVDATHRFVDHRTNAGILSGHVHAAQVENEKVYLSVGLITVFYIKHIRRREREAQQQRWG